MQADAPDDACKPRRVTGAKKAPSKPKDVAAPTPVEREPARVPTNSRPSKRTRDAGRIARIFGGQPGPDDEEDEV